jgi:ubiquinol-cytochrome c reductase cytochrome b subunit
MKITKTNPI